MENEQPAVQQDESQMYNRAAYLLLHEKRSPEDVRNALIEGGVELEQADTVVGNLELQIHAAKKAKANKDMLYGALWCVGGTVMTMADIGFIFWGAIIFGAIQFIRGATNA